MHDLGISRKMAKMQLIDFEDLLNGHSLVLNYRGLFVDLPCYLLDGGEDGSL